MLVVGRTAHAHGVLPEGEGGLDEASGAKEVCPSHPIGCHGVLEVGLQQGCHRMHGAEVPPCCNDVGFCDGMCPQPGPVRCLMFQKVIALVLPYLLLYGMSEMPVVITSFVGRINCR